MKKTIHIKLNGKEVECEEGQTVMAAAKKVGIEIPGLCGHGDFKPNANCRVCVVDIKGQAHLQTSCSTLAKEGMEVTTNSERVKKARDMNLELIFAEHIEKCADCIWRFECKLLHYAEKYKILISTDVICFH